MADFADVALNIPSEREFTYSVPPTLRSQVLPGVRVRVPFRSRTVAGTCVRLTEEAPSFAVRPIQRVLDPTPVFTQPMLRLASWIARRYGAGAGEALDAALPFAVRTGGRRKTVRVVHLDRPPPAAGQDVQELEARHPKQARLLRILIDAGEPVPARDLLRRAKVTESVLKSIVSKGLARIEREVVGVGDPPAGVDRDPVPTLNRWQESVTAELLAGLRDGRREGYLLFGVTGSGKTEVYLRVLREVVDGGRQGIVLVPEIALTPQTVARFRARFPRVAVLHSHLTDAERHDQWRAIQRGEADVVIGARSAVFAPTPRLGLIIIDEEHEPTFKQQNTPRYDAREAARARARFEGASLILGSATPSLEAFHRARVGRLRLLRLPERVGEARFPETIIADLNQTRPAPRASQLPDRPAARIAELLRIAAGAGHPLPESTRIRDRRHLPRLRQGDRLRAMRHRPRVSPTDRPADLPLLWS